jgi:hypothetical protein
LRRPNTARASRCSDCPSDMSNLSPRPFASDPLAHLRQAWSQRFMQRGAKSQILGVR